MRYHFRADLGSTLFFKGVFRVSQLCSSGTISQFECLQVGTSCRHRPIYWRLREKRKKKLPAKLNAKTLKPIRVITGYYNYLIIIIIIFIISLESKLWREILLRLRCVVWDVNGGSLFFVSGHQNLVLPDRKTWFAVQAVAIWGH